MAYEDLHWIDKSSEDVLKYGLENIAGASLLMIFTYRPEFVHTWGGKSYHNQVNLNRLSNRESLTMVEYLLGSDEIDRDLEEMILEKTEGIPFFIEEFLRSLKNLRIIEKKNNKYHLAKDAQKMTIPSTVHDVIMARVDTLPEGAKDDLQTGSVIEREFSYELIKRVTGLPEQELLSHLSVLKDSELLYERGVYPEANYIFNNALTREVVYDSMLTKRQKRLHVEIADAIEDLYKENIESQYGVLAEHYISGENYEKGAEYSNLAGKKAQRSASFKEAIEHVEKEIFCLNRLATNHVTQRKLIDARARLAGYHISLTHHVEANEAVAPITNLALEMNYQKRLPMIYTVMGTYSHWVEEDYTEAYRYLSEALKISEIIKDKVSLWYANFFLGMSLSCHCKFEKGIEYLVKSLELGKLANNPIPISMAKCGMSAFAYMFQGKSDLAYQTSNEALQMALESGDIYIKGIAYSSQGMSCYCKGLLEEAENSLLQALSFCERASQLGWWTWAAGFLGHVYFDMGQYEKAQDYYEQGISALDRTGIYPFWVNMWKVSIARSKVLNNDQDIKPRDLFEHYENINVKVAKGWAARHVAEVLLNIDDLPISEAEDWINKAIEVDKKNCTIWSLGGDYAFYAELLKQKGDQSEAKEKLNKAIEIFKECGADTWEEKYKKELMTL
jgi:predicted ATPase